MATRAKPRTRAEMAQEELDVATRVLERMKAKRERLKQQMTEVNRSIKVLEADVEYLSKNPALLQQDDTD